MVYVDLNPIRAGICKTPETSEYTSICERLLNYKDNQNKSTQSIITKAADTIDTTLEDKGFIQPVSLLPFVDTHNQKRMTAPGIEFAQTDYFKLVDWTGRQVRKDKFGAIPENIMPILDRLKIDESEWLNTVSHYGHRFYRIVGPIELIRKISRKVNRNWFKGMFHCEKLYKKRVTSFN